MLIWLQNEFIPKLHVIIIFILIINQERVVVIKLLMKIMEKRKTERTGQTISSTVEDGGTLFQTKRGHMDNGASKRIKTSHKQAITYRWLLASWLLSCAHMTTRSIA